MDKNTKIKDTFQLLLLDFLKRDLGSPCRCHCSCFVDIVITALAAVVVAVEVACSILVAATVVVVSLLVVACIAAPPVFIVTVEHCRSHNCWSSLYCCWKCRDRHSCCPLDRSYIQHRAMGPGMSDSGGGRLQNGRRKKKAVRS